MCVIVMCLKLWVVPTGYSLNQGRGLADNTSSHQHAPNGAQMTQNQKTKERESRKFEVGSEVFIYSIEYLITNKKK